MDLKLILESHKKWILGEAEGERANLSRANLSGANLSGAYLYGANLSQTCILGFYLGQHFGYAWYKGKTIIIKIGCKEAGLADWLKDYKGVGRAAGYSDSQIKLYGAQLRLIKSYFNKGVLK